MVDDRDVSYKWVLFLKKCRGKGWVEIGQRVREKRVRIR